MKNEHERRCGVCDNRYFERNHYFTGKLMTVRDFFAEQCYFNEKRWFINRMVNGWGVVCGLDVVPNESDPTKVIIKPGLALDHCGREILVCDKQEISLVPEESECHKREKEVGDGKKILVCIEYRECKTERVSTPPISCDQRERGEFNRIRDSFRIYTRVCPGEEPDKSTPCPAETRAESLHSSLCEIIKKGCPEGEENGCVVLAAVSVRDSKVEIDTCSKRKLVYNNALLYDLIRCLHRNYIGTWLVLGPLFNPIHQTDNHYPEDGHPKAAKIIDDIGTNNNGGLNPQEITQDISKAPRHGYAVSYINSQINNDPGKNNIWQIRSFSGVDWMNIHDIEDNIHLHLPGDYTNPFDPKNDLNFLGKHHALAFFLVFIKSPEPRQTSLYIRNDDSVRVWLNGSEIGELKWDNEKDINDYSEKSAAIMLREGWNVLLAAVAETHVEWGFSARIAHDSGLRITPVPQ